MILIFMLAMFIIRLVFLKLSIANEKTIRANGGREFGKLNSQFLTLLHIMVYAFATLEAYLRKTEFDGWSLLGLSLMVFSLVVLYKVTQLLEGIWTVKLMITQDHQYVDHWLFRYVKHPNYYLNICPELIGVALLCHAKITAAILFPFYLVSLSVRIHEENRLIREVIIPNGKVER
ncbi:isoprenylcysteine carboxyl methyltransferase family protein [Streptococcus porcinus]|uniref:Isoprenylcysteine carboxyl methyltransferase (ICMT) family protein n=2 Tax=Streptococcus porcinus TaxID=1340 RepID=A0A4V0H973_STRPO|nr:isoprenylcysteine carboxyl methyltransferase family protein [Streptococcus porcinus]EGJ27256.1 isoprenylcysteine carboxyl methyltransferase family protein [Streptococcus porcinus str. Jelinkova 176]SQG45123.1 isoprenylcysteine carboxyl methyltransferase (ICMT) family protein [Streptococcus porcinus]VTT45924.1 isoprenylcysteine carboxyl methyltransferase (ICMT) family protein [Streptococcus porcinus]